MTQVHETGELGAGVDEVWKLVSDFGGMLEAFGIPVQLSGPEGIGQERTIAMGPGDPTVERLEEVDNDAHRLKYSIQSGPLPVENYLSTMQLTAIDGGRTQLDWSSTFEPGGGLSEADAIAIVSGIYTGGIAGLQARFGA
jgi:Polyketide cyclase / dehydrase and lipid transport